MKNAILTVIALLLLLSASNAFAVPTIDGNINPAGEWSFNLLVNTIDVNEADIPDSYDIKNIRMIGENSGGANDGLYIMMQLYGTPTWTSLDETFPPDPVSYRVALDYNKDGDYSDAVDRVINYQQSGLVVYKGDGTIVSGAASGFMNSVVELYIPKSMLGNSSGAFWTFSRLDNGGEPADDRVPDVGHNKTPEPSSMLLLGMGLFGFAGRIIRKKFMA